MAHMLFPYKRLNIQTVDKVTFTCLKESVNMTLVPLASCIKLQEIEFHGRTDVYSADIRPLSVCVYQTNFPCVVIKIFYSQSLNKQWACQWSFIKGRYYFTTHQYVFWTQQQKYSLQTPLHIPPHLLTVDGSIFSDWTQRDNKNSSPTEATT